MTKRHFQRYFSGLSRNTFLLALASLFADISTEMLYPVLPIFLTQILNASGSVVGLVEGIAGATQNIVQGLSGFLSDRLQRRKSIALAGYFLTAIAKPLIGLSTVWQGVLGARVLDRLGAGTRSAPRDALIASSVHETIRGRAFGLEGAGDNAGAFLGPLLAAFLIVTWELDIRYIFYLALIPGLLAFLMVMFVKERPAEVSAKAKIDVSFRQFQRDYWKYLLVTALFGIGNSSNVFGGDDSDLCRLQSRGRGGFLPGWIPFRPVGKTECPAVVLPHLLSHVSRLCIDAERCGDRGPVRQLRPISGNIPRRRQSTRK